MKKEIKNILLVTPLYPPEIGGPATYAVLLQKELPKRGIAVKVLPFSSVRHLYPGIRHIVLLFKILWKGRKSDVIFAQDVFSVGFSALLAAKILRKPFVVRVPGDYAWEQARQRFGVTDSIDDFQKKKYSLSVEFRRWVQKIVVRNADHVITPSAYFKRIVDGWMPGKSASAIYNGIDISYVRNFSKNSQLSLQAFNVISAGRLVPWKGFKEIISLLPTHEKWRFVLVGDGPMQRELEQYAKEKGVHDRVEFLGSVPQDALFQKIAASDVFILNSSFESFSFQVVEAMALGTPVIATNGCNLEEIMTNGKEGILVSRGDIQALEKAIGLLEQDPELRAALSENAMERAQEFSIDRTVDALVKLLHIL